MPILMTARISGQTREGYQQVIDAVSAAYVAAPGFVLHMSHPIDDDGWCVMDVWHTREQFQQFFAEHVVPRLPPTLRPKIELVELHDVLSIAPVST